MSLSHLLTHRASFTRESYTTSAAGDTARSGTWSATTLTDVACRAVQESGTTDALQSRERATARWTLVVLPSTDLRVRDRATVTLDDGTTIHLEVTEVRRVTAPGRTHHVRLTCQEVTG